MKASRVLRAASLLAFGMAVSLVPPASAQTLTLDEVEARAQRDRPELAERQASIDRASADRDAAAAKGRPTLGARIDLSLSPGAELLKLPYGDPPNTETYYVTGSRSLGQGQSALVPQPRYAAMLSGKLTILDFGRTSLGVRAAEASIHAERASLVQAKVELVRAARKAYLSWIEAHQTWQLARSDAEVTKARTASVRALIAEGARPATDATLSAYDDQLAKLREARAHRASQLALDSLAAALQSELPPESAPELAVLEPEPPVTSPGSDGATAAPSPAQDQALSVLDRQRDAALSAARAAERSRAPQLEVGAEVGLTGVDELVFPVYRAALSLSVPIYDGGALSAAADQQRATARGLDARRERLEREINAARRAAESALRSAEEELAISLELLATAETLLAEAEDHYRSGSDTLERVLSAQRSLVQARREVLARGRALAFGGRPPAASLALSLSGVYSR